MGNREEGPVLVLEDFAMSQALLKRGVYRCDIAQQLGVHPKTVRRRLRRDGPPVPRRGRRGSLLDPYRAVYHIPARDRRR
jgi:IS30 family transposase